MAETSLQPFQFQLAPERLWQAINPWTWNIDSGQVGLVNVNIGATRAPETERAILDEVGSYGRQIGHLGEALAVLIRHFERSPAAETLSRDDRNALDVLKGEVARIDQIKAREQADGTA